MDKMKIMLVDDEDRFLETTAKLLTKKGIDVVTANSGVKALEILLAQEIHIVILDVKMPGMDGIETLKQIKAKYPLVEVIMLTGHGTMDSAIDGLKSGACDYLIKPTDISLLIHCAETAFQKRQILDEKIRMAQSRNFMKSPREIIKNKPLA
ncbi:MAG: response regulator [Candidatus Magnetomorum sp.]|nr:response regulator [Candidatus Magnetomorum sp.]